MGPIDPVGPMRSMELKGPWAQWASRVSWALDLRLGSKSESRPSVAARRFIGGQGMGRACPQMNNRPWIIMKWRVSGVPRQDVFVVTKLQSKRHGGLQEGTLPYIYIYP